MADADQKTASVPSELEELQQKIAELEEQVTLKDEAYKRALADYHNVVRRAQEDRKVWTQMASRDLLTDLLPTLDHLEMALKHFQDASLKMIVGELQRVLSSHGVERLQVIGTSFDPETMEATEVVSGMKDEVVTEQQAGYKLNGTILRHAKVAVGGGETSTQES